MKNRIVFNLKVKLNGVGISLILVSIFAIKNFNLKDYVFLGKVAHNQELMTVKPQNSDVEEPTPEAQIAQVHSEKENFLRDKLDQIKPIRLFQKGGIEVGLPSIFEIVRNKISPWVKFKQGSFGFLKRKLEQSEIQIANLPFASEIVHKQISAWEKFKRVSFSFFKQRLEKTDIHLPHVPTILEIVRNKISPWVKFKQGSFGFLKRKLEQSEIQIANLPFASEIVHKQISAWGKFKRVSFHFFKQRLEKTDIHLPHAPTILEIIRNKISPWVKFKQGSFGFLKRKLEQSEIQIANIPFAIGVIQNKSAAWEKFKRVNFSFFKRKLEESKIEIPSLSYAVKMVRNKISSAEKLREIPLALFKKQSPAVPSPKIEIPTVIATEIDEGEEPQFHVQYEMPLMPPCDVCCSRNFWPKRIEVRQLWGHQEKDCIPFATNFTTVEIFTAPDYCPGSVYPFLDLRGHRFGNNTYAANAGIGGRYVPDYDSCYCEVLGFNLYYDYRQGCIGYYQQMGAGIEVLGCCWDFRANAYAPFGKRKHVHTCVFDDFDGDYFAIRKDIETISYSFNGEIGLWVFDRCDFSLYAALGPYFLARKCHKGTPGIEARIRPQYRDYFAVDLGVRYDDLFGTIWQAEFVFTLPLYQITAKNRCAPCCLDDKRIYQSVERFEVMPLWKRNCWQTNF